MGVSKTTATVAGESNISILTLEQYSVRAKMQIPTSALFASTKRASSGTTRTVTLAEAHGMLAGDYFAYGAFGSASYNPTGAEALGIVLTVPAPDKLTYTASGSLSEAETNDTAGKIVKLGWKRLRIGMRYAIPRGSGDWACGGYAFGLGVAQGTYPVGSSQCVRWWGYTNVSQSSLTYFAPHLYVGYNFRFWRKGAGGGVNANFNTNDYVSVLRANPSMLFMDITKGTGNYVKFSWKMPAYANPFSFTAVKFLAILKSPLGFDSSSGQTIEGVSLSGYTQDLADAGYMPVAVDNGADLYLEPFIKAVGQTMDIMDIGYAVTPP